MVENELLAKTEEDSRDDFSGGYTFDEAFRQPFLPPEQPQPPQDVRETPVGSLSPCCLRVRVVFLAYIFQQAMARQPLVW